MSYEPVDLLLTDTELEALLGAESDRIERKRSLSDPDRIRGAICGLMTTLGGIGHTIPFLLSNFHAATILAVIVVVVELAVITWIRPLCSAVSSSPPSCAAATRLAAAVPCCGVLPGWGLD